MIIGLLNIFWILFKIALFSFGGGYATISLVIEQSLAHDLLTEAKLYQFIGIAESTPGSFYVNMATFIGFENYGVIGAIVAVIAVVLPSFVIILSISTVSERFIKHPVVNSVLNIFKPATIGFILAAGLNVVIKAVFNNMQNIQFDWRALTIFSVASILAFVFKRKMPPVLLILLSGLMGLGLYLI